MKKVKAVGFDFINTLVTIQGEALHKAFDSLVESLKTSGISVDHAVFHNEYRESASAHMANSCKSGIETHNRFWISEALNCTDYDISPYDKRIDLAVDAYFDSFVYESNLIPGTKEMLSFLSKHFPLALLSNFTHSPAAQAIINRFNLSAFFSQIIISGEFGYRKPHSAIFLHMAKGFGFDPEEVLYIGDDPDPDIHGALAAGMQSVWFAFVDENNISRAPGYAPQGTAKVPADIKRITSWEELYPLLSL
jgi:haloacid dehalogenase superfamily, subfamily IA, variant 3 with third motif having DD or ED/haloacid dehalogenase superfamily, subfamily IA, variant 1 with third motif having Dx(3-4)D or Dx(3-4)E